MLSNRGEWRLDAAALYQPIIKILIDQTRSAGARPVDAQRQPEWTHHLGSVWRFGRPHTPPSALLAWLRVRSGGSGDAARQRFAFIRSVLCDRVLSGGCPIQGPAGPATSGMACTRKTHRVARRFDWPPPHAYRPGSCRVLRVCALLLARMSLGLARVHKHPQQQRRHDAHNDAAGGGGYQATR